MAKDKKIAPRVLEAENRMYEIMLVLQPELLENAVEKKLKEFEKFLTDAGSTVALKDLWGKQSLAYKIKKYTEGIYVVYNVTIPSTFIKEIDEHLRIDNDTIRHLVLSISDDYSYSKFDEELEEPEEEVKEKKPVVKKEVKKEVKDIPQDIAEPAGKAKDDDTAKEPKEEVKEEPKEEVKEEAKEEVKDIPQDIAEPAGKAKDDDTAKEPKEESKEEPKEVDKEKLDDKLDKLLNEDDLNI